MNRGMLREEWVEPHRSMRSKRKSVYCISWRTTLVLDALHLRVQAQTHGVPGKSRMSELFLGCSEDKSHSESMSFCSWVRGTEHGLVGLRKSSQRKILPVYLSSFHPENQNPHLRSHSIRILNLPEVCGSRARGKDIPPKHSDSNQTVVAKLCVFWANLEETGSGAVLFKGLKCEKGSSSHD